MYSEALENLFPYYKVNFKLLDKLENEIQKNDSFHTIKSILNVKVLISI